MDLIPSSFQLTIKLKIFDPEGKSQSYNNNQGSSQGVNMIWNHIYDWLAELMPDAGWSRDRDLEFYQKFRSELAALKL